MTRVRVAAAQYYVRPVTSFDEFAAQVTGLVDTAAGYGCKLLAFPEYFTMQLVTLEPRGEPLARQVRSLARHVPAFTELFSKLAEESGMYIVGGTIPVIDEGSGAVYNEARLFSPKGGYGVQGKLHMTRFEQESWEVTPRTRLRVFDTEIGKIAIMICYDVEFPELARVAARAGAYIIVCPSWTDDRQGFLRVRYCAHARCVENQLYVIHSPTVGSLPTVPAISLNYGQAAILTPCDYAFARDGILAEAVPNQETMVIGDLDLDIIERARTKGTVLPLRDSQRSAEVAANLDVVEL